MAMLSILGLYNYEPDIFEHFQAPEGMDRQTVIDGILLDCAELPLLYTDPTFMKLAIKQWKDKEFKIWDKLYATENLDYNPIWNVDATIEETGAREHDRNNTIERTNRENTTGTTTETVDGRNTQTTNNQETGTSTGNGTTTESTAGFNSATWANHNKEDVDSTSETTRNVTGEVVENIDNENTASLNNQTTGTENVSEGESLDENTHLLTRRTGNIGVTTTQQMIQAERDISGFNTIDYIIRSFKKRFCLLVY